MTCDSTQSTTYYAPSTCYLIRSCGYRLGHWNGEVTGSDTLAAYLKLLITPQSVKQQESLTMAVVLLQSLEASSLTNHTGLYDKLVLEEDRYWVQPVIWPQTYHSWCGKWTWSELVCWEEGGLREAYSKASIKYMHSQSDICFLICSCSRSIMKPSVIVSVVSFTFSCWAKDTLLW